MAREKWKPSPVLPRNYHGQSMGCYCYTKGLNGASGLSCTGNRMFTRHLLYC